MKTIQDPVHGYVEVDEKIIPVLDSPEVQRLRYVKQLGFSNLVYPGANHTRFEHSLGAMHLAGLMAKSLSLEPEQVLLAEISALLHDIGHGPYSHASEQLMEEYLHHSHQEIGEYVNAGYLNEALCDLDINPDDVCAMVEGREDSHLITGIIHGDLDVDRMDYLLRDAHYTGAPYGTVDAHRLIRNTTLGDGGLVLRENGISAAESLLIARTLMRPSVYFHHVSRIAETMVTYAALEHLEATKGKDIGELMRMNDAEFSIALSNSPSEEARRLIDLIYRRKLYKRAVYIGMDQVKYSTVQKFVELKDKKSIAEKVCKEAGLDRTDVLVDIPPFPSPMKIDVLVKNHNELVSLDELSPLIGTLNLTRKSEWRMGIYTSGENRKIVEQCAYDILNIERPTKQDKLFF